MIKEKKKEIEFPEFNKYEKYYPDIPLKPITENFENIRRTRFKKNEIMEEFCICNCSSCVNC